MFGHIISYLTYSVERIADSLRKTAKLFSAPRRKAPLPTTNYQLPTNSYQLPTSRGFSLIELLVSMALFIVVITMGVGSLLVLINANLKAQNINDAVSNIQFALDSMAREIRTGEAYYCSGGTETVGNDTVRSDCNKGSYLSIIEGGKSITDDNNNKRIAYRRSVVDGSGVIQRKVGNGQWINLTSQSVNITSMHFNVVGTPAKEGVNNLIQPNVTIFIDGIVTGIGDTSSTFSLQTTVTKRVLDL